MHPPCNLTKPDLSSFFFLGMQYATDFDNTRVISSPTKEKHFQARKAFPVHATRNNKHPLGKQMFHTLFVTTYKEQLFQRKNNKFIVQVTTLQHII